MAKRSPLVASLVAALASITLLSPAPFFARTTSASLTGAVSKPMKYPTTKKTEHTDDYHGVKVADPYRWLEDADSAETKAWVDAQNALTFSYLNEIPARAKIRDRLTKLWNYEKYGVPFKEGGRYFYSKNDGLQNQSVLYTVNSLSDDKPRVLLDPNQLSADGTVALAGYAISERRRETYGLRLGDLRLRLERMEGARH
jgi:prolyl oligopeptidase